MTRIAAIDYGLKRIGIAISDERKKIALPLKTVPGGPNAIEEIKIAFRDKQIELIVIGLPLLLSGKESEMSILVRQFAEKLEKALEIPIYFIDERFTSKIADQSLKDIHLNRKKRSQQIDVTAALILLQNFLDKDSL